MPNDAVNRSGMDGPGPRHAVSGPALAQAESPAENLEKIAAGEGEGAKKRSSFLSTGDELTYGTTHGTTCGSS